MLTCDTVFFPAIDTTPIEEFQARFFPHGAVLPPHIRMLRHKKRVPKELIGPCVKEIVSTWKPFEIHLNGVDKSDRDGWLLLRLQQGDEEIFGLQNALRECFQDYGHTCTAPEPGIILGFFARDRGGRNEAYQEALKLNLSYRTLLDRITITTFDSSKNRIVDTLEFKLGP